MVCTAQWDFWTQFFSDTIFPRKVSSAYSVRFCRNYITLIRYLTNNSCFKHYLQKYRSDMEFWLDYPSVPKNASGLNRSKNEWKTWICMISLLFLTRFEIKLEEAVKISAYEFKLLIRLCFFWDTAHPGVKWQLFWSKVSLWTVHWWSGCKWWPI